MNHTILTSLLVVINVWSLAGPAFISGREFLTEREIEKIRQSQTIDARTRIYAEAALLRLSTVEQRFLGIESEEGDPLEFFSREEMLDGYFRIMTSIMHNLEDAFESPRQEPERVRRALTLLKKTTGEAEKKLSTLKKLAEKNREEAFIILLNRALDITHGAHAGAEEGLSSPRISPPPRLRQ
jgi:hypothetical protein